MEPNYIFSELNENRISEMQRAMSEVPSLSVVHSTSNDLRQRKGLDAFYLSTMAAEKWGPSLKVHEADILETSEADAQEGWPPYVIAGVVMAKNDKREPSTELRMIVAAVTKAVLHFNVTAEKKISKVGFTPEWTRIKTIEPYEAGEIIVDAYLGALKQFSSA